MGGKALKTIEVSSMNKTSFETVSKEVIEKIRKELNTSFVEVLPYYRDKATFSDIDVVISKDAVEKYGFDNFHNYLREGLKSPEQKGNSQIYSFGYNHDGKFYQVDLMYHDEKVFDKAITYFAYNDLNILMNFIATSNFDLTFKKEGINHVIYGETKTQKVGDYLAEINFYDVLDFLGLNKEQHKIGFSSLKDMYDFIYESPYFDTAAFKRKTEKENREELKRAERKTYSGFIQYIKEKPAKRSILMNKTHDERLDLFFHTFPHAKKQYENILENNKKITEFRKVFNGFNISNLLGIKAENKVLGAIMRKVKLDFQNNEMNIANWTKENGVEKLNNLILETHKEMLNEKEDWQKYLGGKNKP